ncbi:MAG: LysR family transcriptional regulator [Vicinamibacteraceae bacterium]|nr:LysR family transcriptional regulator [Vicinamibacteraceae bacterium]
MDLRQLEIIRAIAETGSFTGAGARLGVSQSAISRQILLLEEELDEPVFLRVGRRVRITAAGEALLQLSHRVFRDLGDTLAAITDTEKPLIGTLHLVGGMTVSLYVFPALLREFGRIHPQADVKISAGSGERCAAMIRSGTADLGLLTLPVDEPDLVTVPAIEEELLLVTSDSHALAARKRVTSQDLKGVPFVLFEPGSNTRRVIDQFFAREGIEPRIVMETENVEIIKALVRVGLGVGIVPYQAVSREPSSGHLFITRVQGAELVRKTGWVYARTSRVPRAVDAVIQVFERVKPKLRLSPNHERAGRKIVENES